MKIAIFSINPIFPDLVTGGASKHLFHIAGHLGAAGHTVEIYCAQAEGSREPFKWADHVLVLPRLPFDLPFPQPYAVSGPDLALITERLRAGLETADRFYVHDGEWLLPDVYQAIPTVTSFRDNIYPESVLGSFITQADEILCVSPFSAAVIAHTAGRFYPDLKNRVHLVNNGIDFDQFKPQDPAPLAKALGLNLERDLIVLHPHRPEPGKGLFDTIQVAAQLVHQAGLSDLKILTPEWIGEMVSGWEKDYQTEMLQLMNDLDVRDNFRFIPWLPNNRMPELYSLGRVTLCLGSIVEAFGNVAYESLACGTPSIVARVGVHRTLMPEDLIHKVHHGDTQAAAGHVLEIINQNIGVQPEALRFMHDHMDFGRQVETYARIITGCSKRDRLTFQFEAPTSSQPFQIAPWCYLKGERIYHDFRGAFEPAEGLAGLFEKQASISKEMAVQSGISESHWQTWLDRTYLVPQS